MVSSIHQQFSKCKNTIFISHFFKIFRNGTIFFLFLCQPLRCPRIASNVVAAWRQAGASVRLGREQKMMLPALCQTRLHPRLRQTAR